MVFLINNVKIFYLLEKIKQENLQSIFAVTNTVLYNHFDLKQVMDLVVAVCKLLCLDSQETT